MGKYKSVFLIPKDVREEFTDDGWVFYGSERISEEMANVFLGCLSLRYVEEYDGVVSYSGSGVQINVVKDDFGCVEYIHIKCYSLDVNDLKKIISGLQFSGVRCFIP